MIAVEGEFDLFRTPELKSSSWSSSAMGPAGSWVDLAGTTYVDSTAFALLMSLPGLVPGGVVVAACDNAQIRKAFEITGADRQVAVEPDVEPALDHVEQFLPAA